MIKCANCGADLDRITKTETNCDVEYDCWGEDIDGILVITVDMIDVAHPTTQTDVFYTCSECGADIDGVKIEEKY